MAFVVEDGTGLPSANSYVDVSYADAYFARKGNAEWAKLTPETKENELINGTEYVDKRFGAKLGGRPLNLKQALEFPRYGLKDRYGRDVTGVPKDIKDSTCEYAMLSSSGTLHPMTGQVDTNIKSTTVKVGPITKSTSFVDSKRTVIYLDHPIADRLVLPYTFGGFGGTGKVMRN